MTHVVYTDNIKQKPTKFSSLPATQPSLDLPWRMN